MRRVYWDFQAIDDLLSLAGRDARQAERIRLALRQYASQGVGNVRKLSGRENQWRLRVGDWRVIYRQDPSGADMEILAVRLRRDAYD